MRRGRVGVAVSTGLLLALIGCTTGGTTVDRRTEPSPSAADPALARRAAHTATDLGNGTSLVAGGCDVDGCSTATASSALLTDAGARPVAPLHTPRDAHTATRLADGRVLAVGGFEGEGRPPLGSVELFDPRSGRWHPTGALRTPRGGHAAARFGDGRVLVAGGWAGPGRLTASTEIYDPRTGVFTSGPQLPAAVMSLTATALPSGDVLVVGGQRDGTVATGAAVIIGADGRSRVLPAGLATPRFKHAAVALASGEVLLLGGTRDDVALLTSTEVFDPTTERFRPGPVLLGGRYKLSDGAVALPDGRVLVAGSGPGVEVVDLDRGRSRLADGLTDVAASFSTVSVVGRELWVLGGYDDRIRLTGTNRRVPLADL